MSTDSVRYTDAQYYEMVLCYEESSCYKTAADLFAKKFPGCRPNPLTIHKAVQRYRDGQILLGKRSDEKNENIDLRCINKYEVDFGFDVTPKWTPLLLLVPIVYTTKLDDMLIFNEKIGRHTNFKKIIERIQEESKPLFKKLPKVPRNFILNYSFNELKEKILEINSLSKRDYLETVALQIIENATSVANTNKEKLLQCKPLSIVIEKLNLDECKRRRNATKKEAVTTVDLTSDFEDDDSDKDLKYVPEEPKKKNKQIKDNTNYHFNVTFEIGHEDYSQPEILNANKLNTSATDVDILKEVSLILYDNCSDNADIYYLNKDGCVAEHYKVKSYNEENLYMYVRQKRAYRFDLCCWYKRNETIKSMLPKFISEMTAKFLYKPHYCTNVCFCCCRKPNHPINFVSFKHQTVPTTTPILKSGTDIWLTKLGLNRGNSTIKHHGMHYNKIERQKKINPKNSIDSYETYCPVLFSKFNGTHHKYCKLYEIGSKGNLLRYDMTLASVPMFYYTCCWYRHQDNLALIRKGLSAIGLSNEALATIKYMEITHSCPIGGCNCCCRSDILLPLSLLNLPRDFQSPTIRLKKLPNVNIVPKVETLAIRIKPICEPTEVTENLRDVLLKHSKYVMASQQQLNKCKVNLTSVIKTSRKRVTKSIKNRSRNKKQEKARNPNQMSVASEPCPTVTPSPSVQTEPKTSTNSDDDVVQHLIGSMLNTFKDVKLTINEEGRVAATLHTPVSSLSSAELKVLSHILTHAQDQVTALRLSSRNVNFNQVSSQFNQHQLNLSDVGAQLHQINSNLAPESQASSSFQTEYTNTLLPKIDQIFSIHTEAGNSTNDSLLESASNHLKCELDINTKKRKINNDENPILNTLLNNNTTYAVVPNQVFNYFGGGPMLEVGPLTGSLNTTAFSNVPLLNNTRVATPPSLAVSFGQSCPKRPRISPETIIIPQNAMMSENPEAPVEPDILEDVDLGINVDGNEGDITPDIEDDEEDCCILGM